MKTCTKCGVEKPLDEFGLNGGRKDGRHSWCRACLSERMRNKRATDPAFAERQRQHVRAWYRGEKLEPLPKKSADQRFDEKWIEDENGCHIWEAAKDDDGYGKFKGDGKIVLAHRWSYVRAYGPIPAGHELHHTCGVPACVNPEHLVEVTEEAHRELHVKRPA